MTCCLKSLEEIRNLGKLKETVTDDGLAEFKAKISRVMTLIYIILGGAISVFIQEIDVRPFPSPTFVISSVFILFCGIIAVVANWKQ